MGAWRAWGFGALGLWGFGALGFWGFGALGSWGFGVLGFWGLGVWGFWGFGVLGVWGFGCSGFGVLWIWGVFRGSFSVLASVAWGADRSFGASLPSSWSPDILSGARVDRGILCYDGCHEPTRRLRVLMTPTKRYL